MPRTCNWGQAPWGVFLRSISGTLQVNLRYTPKVRFRYTSGIITLRRLEGVLMADSREMPIVFSGLSQSLKLPRSAMQANWSYLPSSSTQSDPFFGEFRKPALAKGISPITKSREKSGYDVITLVVFDSRKTHFRFSGIKNSRFSRKDRI